MSFLLPLGLLALLSLPIIVLLHLMRERRRRVVVPSLLLWHLMPQRREAQQRRRLPLTLLLLLHLLAAAALALALGAPAISLSRFASERHSAYILDTSTSMAAPAPGLAASTRLQAAQAQVQTAINALGPRDTLTIIAAGPTARLLVGPSNDAPQLLAALAELSASGTGTALSSALTLAEAALQDRPDARIIVLTDAAIPTLASDVERNPPALPVEWALVGAPLDNRALVTLAARPRSANGPIQVYARAVNYGLAPTRTNLRLYRDDLLIDTRSLTLNPDGEAEVTFTLPPGGGLLRAEIDGNDSLPADDQIALNLNPNRPIEALLVGTESAELTRALSVIPNLTLRTLDGASYLRAPTPADLTIFNGIVPESSPAGGVLLINPPLDNLLLPVQGRSADDLNAPIRATSAASVFDGLSVASLGIGNAVQITPPIWATVLLERADTPLVLQGSVERSNVMIWAFDLSDGSVTSRLAFPLLVARTVRAVTPAALPAAALLGQTLSFTPDPRTDTLQLRMPNGAVEHLPITPGEPIARMLDQSGIYTLSELAAGTTLFSTALPVNAGAPAESALGPRPLPNLQPTLATSSSATREPRTQDLWPWFAGLALLVMMVEWFYLHGARRAPQEV
jgi:hypothetical protein